jgi:hypothetical protein
MNLLRLRQFIKKTSNNLKKKGYLFDFKGRINYILEFCKKVDNNNESNDSCLVQITNVRDVNNYLIDKYPEKYIKDKNIIFVRETEFGKSFANEELLSILTYNFNIHISQIIKKRIIEKNDDKNLNIYKTKLEEGKILTRLIKFKSILPIFQMNDNKINDKCIQIIEYLYFLFLPLLIQEKSKPKVLIISDDYGILYNYYKAIYGTKLDILFVSQKYKDEEIFNKEIVIEKNNKKDINSYEDVFRMFNNKTLFDLIIVEQCFNDNEIETTIPSVKNNFANLLTPNGIFSLNIRSCSIYNQNFTINNLKKKFKNIKKINFRICSDFLICSNKDKIQIIEDFTKKYPKLSELENYEVYLGLFIDDIET